jgi:hypothetical protein
MGTLSNEHLCNVPVAQSLCKFAARETEFGQPRSDKCTASAAQKKPLIRNRQTRGLLKQLNLDSMLTAEGGLTTVSYAKTAC